MASPLKNIPIYTYDNSHTLTPLENAFISCYILCKNATRAVVEAGYKSKNPRTQAQALLSRDYVTREIKHRLEEQEQARIAKGTEVLQFYTSVMRGEVLDQFGIEASLDTRIKAANELAKHQIEIPLKLQQKADNNNVGSITINFKPRISENAQDD